MTSKLTGEGDVDDAVDVKKYTLPISLIISDFRDDRHENKSCSACRERVNERVWECESDFWAWPWKQKLFSMWRVIEWESVRMWECESVTKHSWFPAFVWHSDIFIYPQHQKRVDLAIFWLLASRKSRLWDRWLRYQNKSCSECQPDVRTGKRQDNRITKTDRMTE